MRDQYHCPCICGAVESDQTLTVFGGRLPYFSPVQLHFLLIKQMQLVSTSVSPCPLSEAHTYVPDLRWPSFLPETRPRGRQKSQIRGRRSERGFGVNARQVLKHVLINIY